MTSNYICRSCLRALGRQNANYKSLPHISWRRSIPPPQAQAESRYFRTSSSLLQQSQPQSPSSDPNPKVKDDTTAPQNEISNSAKSSDRSIEDLPPAPSASDLQSAITANRALRARSSPVTRIATKLREAAPTATETYVSYGATQALYTLCAQQADYTLPPNHAKTENGEDIGVPTKEANAWWYDKLGLTPTFAAWSQITFIHMYILTTRFRMFSPDTAPPWHQHLTDHFFRSAEDRMESMHNISQRAMRTKYLKDLFNQWRGVQAAYDEGLVKGDAVLAAAVWRNVFNGDVGVNAVDLATVTSYLRRNAVALARVSDVRVQRAEVAFGEPEDERRGVLVQSPLMKEVQA